MRPSELNRALAIVFAAYLFGLGGVIAGIAIWDSHAVIASSLAVILAAMTYGRFAFRCPLCRAAVFLAPVSQAVPWITGKSRRCPRCRTDYHEAWREIRQPRPQGGRAG